MAEEDLEGVYQFYVNSKSVKAANKVYNEILDAADLLADFPQMAPIEYDLSDDGEEYRALVVKKHFKIVYYTENDAVYIAAVWDCRQNPQANIDKIKD